MACHHITQQVSFTHPRRPKVGRHWEWDEKRLKWKLVWYDDPGGVGKQTVSELKVVWYDDPGGVGKQTVSELKVCPDCAKMFPSEKKAGTDHTLVAARRSAGTEYTRKYSPCYD